MVRKDKKNRKCICCDKTFAIPQKLRQHYKSNKNQCRLAPDNIPKQALAPETSSQKEKPKVINQTPDPKASSGPSTQVYREETQTPKPHRILEMQVVLLEICKAINLLAMKMLTSGIRSNMNLEK